MRRAWTQLVRLVDVSTDPKRVLPLLLYAVPFGFGFFLLLRPDSFDTAPAYDTMERFASESEWGHWSMACTVLCLGLWCLKHFLARLLSFALMLFWHGFVAWCIFDASIAPGTWTYMVLAGAATSQLIRAAVRGRND